MFFLFHSVHRAYDDDEVREHFLITIRSRDEIRV
jgi:hypothetical protein